MKKIKSLLRKFWAAFMSLFVKKKTLKDIKVIDKTTRAERRSFIRRAKRGINRRPSKYNFKRDRVRLCNIKG